MQLKEPNITNELNSYYDLRKSVYCDELKWFIASEEMDSFDLKAKHFVVINDDQP